MDIGERLRELRKGRYSQEELGHLLHVHNNTISKWENGEMEPRSKKIKELARVLDTTTAYLLGDTDDPSPAHDVREEPEPSTVEKRNNGYLIYKDGERLVELPPTPEGYALIEKFMMQKHAASGDGI